MSTTTVTSLDGFHATPTARRTDELARAFFDAVNAGEQTRIDELLNLAATGYFKRIEDVNDEEWDHAGRGEVDLVYYLTRAIVGPDGETPASLSIASTPLRSSKD